MPEILSRADAKARGMKRYMTGKSCSRGHVAERNCSNGGCVECDNVSDLKWRKANKDKIAEKNRIYRTNNPDASRKCYEKNPIKYRNNSLNRYYVNRNRVLERQRTRGAAVKDLLAVLREEMPELLKEFGI